jgi:hypothetical protein
MQENGKRLYLTLAIAGTILPYYFFGTFLLSHGLDIGLLLEQLFANRVSTFFAVDLIISAVVFLVFSYSESKRLGIARWWVFVASSLLVGPSCSLPLFLFFREGKLRSNRGSSPRPAIGSE